MKTYDIIVLGGGFTGCAAAIAAARQGQQVLLLESSGFLGGAASNCLIYPFMRYHTTITHEDGSKERHDLSRGIFSELVAELVKRGGGKCFYDEDLKVILDEKTMEAGVDVLFHATLCGVCKDGNHIKSLSVATKAGVLTFEGSMFIDCTGDADLCTYAGIPTRLGREADKLCQPMTLCFRVANVDKKTFFAHRQEMQKLYKEWQAAGKIKNIREDILAFDHPTEGALHFNTTRIVQLNPVDPL
ncbi:MAG: FAD-dependent oxidoreductase, partial [Clostridia bacterium]|nr:FAD-dependent oxidoreductase [Clostridia bacterium]